MVKLCAAKTANLIRQLRYGDTHDKEKKIPRLSIRLIAKLLKRSVFKIKQALKTNLQTENNHDDQ